MCNKIRISSVVDLQNIHPIAISSQYSTYIRTCNCSCGYICISASPFNVALDNGVYEYTVLAGSRDCMHTYVFT